MWQAGGAVRRRPTSISSRGKTICRNSGRPAKEAALLNGGIDDLLHGDPALTQHGSPLLDHHGEGFEPEIGLADLVMVLQAITDFWAWRVWGYQEMVDRAFRSNETIWQQ